MNNVLLEYTSLPSMLRKPVLNTECQNQIVVLQLTRTFAFMQDFYLSKHSGRRLVWHNSLGSCVMRAHFSKAVKELSVSLFQVRLQLVVTEFACQDSPITV